MKTVIGERRCLVCSHDSVGDINRELIGGESTYRSMERAYFVNRCTLNNHYRLCLLPKIISGGEINGL
jgi:hypothetical protein